jgi:hypothetical protein
MCPIQAAPMLRAALSSLADPSADPVAVFGGEGSKADKRRRCRSELRRMAQRYDALANAERFHGRAAEADQCRAVAVGAIVVLLVHFPRLSAYTGSDTWCAPRGTRRGFVPAQPDAPDTLARSADAREAVCHGARIEWDHYDRAAAGEAESVEFLADLNDTPVPMMPSVARSREIEAAYKLGRFDPWRPQRNRGQFQTQNAQRASERVAAGGAGKRDIRTREDKSRWAIKAAARRLDVLEASASGAQVNPLLAQAIALVRGILAPCRN